MRIYVLVVCYQPLTVYLYREGFGRFTHNRYSNNAEDLSNTFMHLTNVAIQKTADNYDEKLGGKWDLRGMKLYLMSKYGSEKVNESYYQIQELIIRCLQSVSKTIINDKHCFELYGFDVLLDDVLKPWLIEVNASPSLSTTTAADRKMKMSVMESVFQIVVPNEWFNENSKHGTNLCTDYQVGSFNLIIDESHTDIMDNARKI